MVFLFSVLSIILPIVFGILLLLLPVKISKILVTEKEEGDAEVGSETLQAIVLALGAYFVANALFDSVYLLAKFKIYSSVIDSSELMARAPRVLPEDFASIVSTLFQLGIGLFLFLGSKGVTRFVTYLRGKPITN
jgi:hypothetical protein